MHSCGEPTVDTSRPPVEAVIRPFWGILATTRNAHRAHPRPDPRPPDCLGRYSPTARRDQRSLPECGSNGATALLVCPSLTSAAFDVLDIKRFVFTAFDLLDCGAKLVIFALPLL